MLELPPPIVSPAIIRPIGPRLLQPGYLPVSREARRAIVSELRRQGVITKDQARTAMMLILPASATAGIGGNDANTHLLIQPSGADGSTSFADNSQNGHTVTRNGDAEVDTDITFLGQPSVLFDGSGDYLTVANDATLRPGTGDFTIDYRLRLAAGSASQSTWAIGYVTAGGQLHQVNTSNQLTIWIGAGLSLTSSTLSVGTSYHIAVVRNGSTLTLFVDGVDDANTTDSTDLNSTATLYIGSASTATPVNGNMGEIRYSNVARWTSGFTPPAGAYS